MLTFQLHDKIMEINDLLEEKKLEEVVRILRSVLPQQNYIVLKYLMEFLVEVSMRHKAISLLNQRAQGGSRSKVG